MELIFLGFIMVFVIFIILTSLVIVPQSKAYVITRLGVYQKTLEAGLSFKMPILDVVAKRVSLKEQVIDFAPQPVITKDNVTMNIDTVVYFQITDSKLYAYGVERPLSALGNLTATSLRNIIGDLELDATLTSRDVINTKMRAVLDEATDPWGIKINRVELKNIIPPSEIQDAMERQMKAERLRRESILIAEGEKRSAILVAEGEKESAILRADAKKETSIREAQGEAEAIITVQKAKAEAIRMLNEAGTTKEVLSLKAMESFEKVADGRATKIIIPSELQNIANIATAFTATTEELKAENAPKPKKTVKKVAPTK